MLAFPVRFWCDISGGPTGQLSSETEGITVQNRWTGRRVLRSGLTSKTSVYVAAIETVAFDLVHQFSLGLPKQRSNSSSSSTHMEEAKTRQKHTVLCLSCGLLEQDEECVDDGHSTRRCKLCDSAFEACVFLTGKTLALYTLIFGYLSYTAVPGSLLMTLDSPQALRRLNCHPTIASDQSRQ